ncbi:MAG TPA: nickel pincer cofactor biosynthesis protein LarC [Tepidisphaeraceae bacterium]
MIGYLDIPSGLSGDMFLSCLVDAGWPVENLRATLARLSLPAEEYQIHAQTVMKGALRATQVSVQVVKSKQHRHLHHIREILDASDISKEVKDRALGVFTRLAEAEARVHGTTIDKVHFHEVGAVDAIVDIVGTCAGIKALDISELYASAAPLGHGWVKTEHGQLPLPAPAVLEILAAAKVPTRPAPGEGELLTPTGAALLAHLATFGQPAMTLHRIGIGSGQRNFAWPNVARLWLGEANAGLGMVELTTNIDDMNPQFYTPVMEKLFRLGAADVWLVPAQMKKGRPAVVLHALATADREGALADALLRETTTLGVRVHDVHRHEARRAMRRVMTEFGEVAVKVKWVGEELIDVSPEFEECRALGEARGVPVSRIYAAAQAAGREDDKVPS